MTEDEIKEEILSELGAPVVKVELDDTHWKTIFKKSKRWFHAKKGVPQCGLFPAGREMDMPPNSDGIFEVVLAGQGESLGCLLTMGFFDDIVPADILARGGQLSTTFGSYSAYAQLVSQLEIVRRLFNSEPDWYIQCNKIILMGVSNTPSGLVLIVFKKKEWEITELRDRDEEMFYRYCLAEAKYILGRILRKYGSYPSAGGMVDTDGQTLVEEAKEEKEILDEEIAQSQYPMGLVTG